MRITRRFAFRVSRRYALPLYRAWCSVPDSNCFLLQPKTPALLVFVSCFLCNFKYTTGFAVSLFDRADHTSSTRVVPLEETAEPSHPREPRANEPRAQHPHRRPSVELVHDSPHPSSLARPIPPANVGVNAYSGPLHRHRPKRRCATLSLVLSVMLRACGSVRYRTCI